MWGNQMSKEFYKNQDKKLIESITFYINPDSTISEKIKESEFLSSIQRVSDLTYIYTDSAFHVNGLIQPRKIKFMIDIKTDKFKVSAYDLSPKTTMSYFHNSKNGLVTSSLEVNNLKVRIIQKIMSINSKINGFLYPIDPDYN